MMRSLSLLPPLLSLSVLLAACSDDPPVVTQPDGPFGTLATVHGCKSQLMLREGAGTSESCVQYAYDTDGRILSLTHENAAFNCCPDQIIADISIEDTSIVIREREINGRCDCDCLYDLDMRIEKLPPGTYRIRFEESYRADDDPVIDFQADLVADPDGRICVPRTHYPWGF